MTLSLTCADAGVVQTSVPMLASSTQVAGVNGPAVAAFTTSARPAWATVRTARRNVGHAEFPSRHA